MSAVRRRRPPSAFGARRYRWTGTRYVERATGRVISERAVREALDRALTAAETRARRLAERLTRGTIDRDAFRRGLGDLVRETTLYAAALAAGGWDNMTPTAYGRSGAAIRAQERYLDGWMRELAATGQTAHPGRAGSYAQAPRATYEALVQERALARGLGYVRSVLGAAEHCDDCVRLAALGYVPAREMTPIGRRRCRVRCRCRLLYRRASA